MAEELLQNNESTGGVVAVTQRNEEVALKGSEDIEPAKQLLLVEILFQDAFEDIKMSELQSFEISFFDSALQLLRNGERVPLERRSVSSVFLSIAATHVDLFL